MEVQDREWLGLQNFLAQANVRDLDWMTGSGTSGSFIDQRQYWNIVSVLV